MIIYKPVSGFPGYEVSSDGRLWSRLRQISRQNKRTGLLLGAAWKIGPERRELPGTLSNGYLRTILYQGGKRVNWFLHVLICEAFHGPRPSPYPAWHACHTNGDPLDNRPSNLRWATPKENMADQYIHGTRIVGEKHPAHAGGHF